MEAATCHAVSLPLVDTSEGCDSQRITAPAELTAALLHALSPARSLTPPLASISHMTLDIEMRGLFAPLSETQLGTFHREVFHQKGV